MADGAFTAQEFEALSRFKAVTEQELPVLAKQNGWPIRFDHCFKRICLDWAFGSVWHQQIARPAERHLRGEHLQRALQCAEELLVAGLPVLMERDAASLRWRGKAPKG